ncbi:MAG: hypothetical protein JSV19_04840 [Phycisphaerales bacterium]|nr:MAG: hypothetical protein JSV19_04840 [Phycisphaerales bacterium]
MMTEHLRIAGIRVGRSRVGAAALLCVGLSVSGCYPGGSADGAASGDSVAVDAETDVAVPLGSAGRFDFADTQDPVNSLPVDIGNDVPHLPPHSAMLSIDPDDVSITSETGGLAQTTATLTVRVGQIGQPDVCAEGVPAPTLQLELDPDGAVSVTPDSVDLPDELLPTLSSGEFELCLVLSSAGAGQTDIEQLTIRYVTSSDLTGLSCERIVALPAVQDALDVLDGENDDTLTFALNEGTTPLDIVDSYFWRDRVTFNPNDPNADDVHTGTVTFANQVDTTVERSGFDATITQWIQGAGNDVSLCVITRTHNPDCDQTIARLESLSWYEEDQVWDGRFLAVVAERHTPGQDTCSDVGSFNYGETRYRLSFAGDGELTDEEPGGVDGTGVEEPPADEDSREG